MYSGVTRYIHVDFKERCCVKHHCLKAQSMDSRRYKLAIHESFLREISFSHQLPTIRYVITFISQKKCSVSLVTPISAPLFLSPRISDPQKFHISSRYFDLSCSRHRVGVAFDESRVKLCFHLVPRLGPAVCGQVT